MNAEKTLYGVLFTLGLVLAIFLYQCTTATGEVSYCYISTTSHWTPDRGAIVTYELRGHRSWRGDRTIATSLLTLEDAKAKADLIGCTIK